MPVWNQALLEILVLELVGHLLAEVCLGVVVDVGVLEEDAELAVETSLNIPAIVGKNTRLSRELKLLMLGVDVLLKTLNRRYPGWLADESRDLLDVWLDRR